VNEYTVKGVVVEGYMRVNVNGEESVGDRTLGNGEGSVNGEESVDDRPLRKVSVNVGGLLHDMVNEGDMDGLLPGMSVICEGSESVTCEGFESARALQ
jgi:hypothetical protein